MDWIGNVLHRIRCLNIWFSANGTVLEGSRTFRRGTWLEEIGHWRQVYTAYACSLSILWFLVCGHTLANCLMLFLPCFPYYDALCLSSCRPNYIFTPLPRFCLAFVYSNRKVMKTVWSLSSIVDFSSWPAFSNSFQHWMASLSNLIQRWSRSCSLSTSVSCICHPNYESPSTHFGSSG